MPSSTELGPPSRRSRGGRLLHGELLRALLLSLIAERPRHGYELIRDIKHGSGGAYAPSPGVVYPALARLQTEGLITVLSRDDLRTAYALTENGALQLPYLKGEIGRAKEQLDRLRAAASVAHPPPVARALENLRRVLEDRLTAQDSSRDLALQVADLLDDVSRKIERL